ncbi:MAG: hypothetical protein Q7R80_04895 [bacterium]|nr:hypothetical protein [bacterium]
MIIAAMLLAALAGAAKIILRGKGRPSLRRTFVGFPLVVIGLSLPFLLEEGCMVPYHKAHVVTRDTDGIITKHALIAWCPKRCVNVPREITVQVTVRAYLVYKFEALFTVESPESFVEYLGLAVGDRIVSSADAETAASRSLTPRLDGYFATDGLSYLGNSEKSFRLEAMQDDLSRTMIWGRWRNRVEGRILEEIFPLASMGLTFSGLRGQIAGVAGQ